MCLCSSHLGLFLLPLLVSASSLMLFTMEGKNIKSMYENDNCCYLEWLFVSCPVLKSSLDFVEK